MSERHKILIGFPYNQNPCMGFETARGLYRASKDHDCGILGACGSWGNFNQLLAKALNMAAIGEITHLAFLHADISPEEYWLDILADELDRTGLDMISVAVPIKDPRGLSSSGIGNKKDRWHPYKRFTMSELWDLPETFDAADAGYPGWPLLHNDGCWLADLRRPVFATVNGENVLVASFDFPRRIIFRNGQFEAEGESEDWYWSRKLWELGAKTAITRKVKLTHTGGFEYPNSGRWGTMAEDQDTTWKRAAETPIEDENACIGVSVGG